MTYDRTVPHRLFIEFELDGKGHVVETEVSIADLLGMHAVELSRRILEPAIASIQSRVRERVEKEDAEKPLKPVRKLNA